MRSTKILHCADIHLDAPFRFLGQRADQQRLQIRNTFHEMCRKAAAEEYDLLLIAGDLFDSNFVSDSTVRWVTDCLRDAELPVFVCPGNHDCLDQRSVYRRTSMTWPSNVFVFADPTTTSYAIPTLDLIIYAAPVCSARQSASPLDSLKRQGDARWHIAMAHGSIVIPGKVEDADAPIRLQDIESSQFDYLALGHWHSWGDYSTDNVKAIYPGSPERMDFSGGLGTVACVSLADGGVSVQRLEVGARRMDEMSIAVTGMADAEKVKREILRESDSHLALRVTLEGLSDIGLQNDVAAIHAQLADKFFFLLIDDRSHPALMHISEELFPENLVIGKYVRSMKRRIEGSASDEEAVAILEEALRLGVALLQGRQAV